MLCKIKGAFLQALNRWAKVAEGWQGLCYLDSMTGTTRKFHRSDFFRSLNIVWHSKHHLHRARMDFWGAVVVVSAMALLVKLAQNLLTN